MQPPSDFNLIEDIFSRAIKIVAGRQNCGDKFLKKLKIG
jgi:hypothetical protein